MMNEIKRNGAFINHLQYARYPSRCTFTIMSSFLSHKSQGGGYHYYPHFKMENLGSERLNTLTKVMQLKIMVNNDSI